MKTQTNIIVVDDELGICKNVEKILKKNNLNVVQAQSASQALEMMQDEPFSLLISDIMMPDINGLELLKTVKKDFPQTKTIMMTGYASTETAIKAIRLGALDYITKPFTPDELRTTVNNVIQGDFKVIDASDQELKSIDVMDIEIDFGKERVVNLNDYKAKETQKKDEEAENYCSFGEMVCDVFEKLGATCKSGLKKNVCPKNEAKKRKAAKKTTSFDSKRLIGIDQPFDYDEVVSITGPEYVKYMDRDGFSFLPYSELKKRALPGQELSTTTNNKESYTRDFETKFSKDILIVDDEVSVNNNIRKILSKKEFHIDQAVSKEEAMERISETSYKLVILDLKMPGVSGLELLKAISERQPSAKIVIITGYASIETAIEAARLGAVDYLPKPFTPQEMRTVTDRAFTLAA